MTHLTNMLHLYINDYVYM